MPLILSAGISRRRSARIVFYSILCISFWHTRIYLPWFRGEGLGFQELGPQLELQHMVAQRVPELNLPAESTAVRLHLFKAKLLTLKKGIFTT
jgi:hypothetical protein